MRIDEIACDEVALTARALSRQGARPEVVSDFVFESCGADLDRIVGTLNFAFRDQPAPHRQANWLRNRRKIERLHRSVAAERTES